MGAATGGQAMTRITWHTAMLDQTVWALRRGHFQAAAIFARGRFGARVRFDDTGKLAQRRYEEIFARNVAKRGSDKPVDVVETPLSTYRWEARNGAES